MEFEKYRLVLEFEEANRPLTIYEKRALLPYSIEYVRTGLSALERAYCAVRYIDEASALL